MKFVAFAITADIGPLEANTNMKVESRDGIVNVPTLVHSSNSKEILREILLETVDKTLDDIFES